MSSEQALAIDQVEGPSAIADFMVLTKARLTSLVLMTTFLGFCMASPGPIDWLLLFNTLLGTALVAGSAAVLNQAMEARVDGLMERTRARPLPAGRMKPESAFSLGGLMAALGMAWLAVTVNLTTVTLAAATVAIYLFLYTPLKRKTSLCVAVGAISGAIPPVIGWTAVEPRLAAGAWILFGVLFLWQIPHFLAIAWLYRDEYAQAGFRMLPLNDSNGSGTAWRAFGCSLGLLAVALLPVVLGIAGPIYLAGGALLNSLMVVTSGQFLIHRTRPAAKRVFFASILYLPLLLGLLVFTKN